MLNDSIHYTYRVDENIIGVPEMWNNYGAIRFLIFQNCNHNIGLVIALFFVFVLDYYFLGCSL